MKNYNEFVHECNVLEDELHIARNHGREFGHRDAVMSDFAEYTCSNTRVTNSALSHLRPISTLGTTWAAS
jgi:hypothetical protein